MNTVYIIMGVSGVGKTTIGKAFAQALKVPFYDADDYHPNQNKEKMAAGVPLNDQDRKPWLDTLAKNINIWQVKGAVLACSALKESYRSNLRDNNRVSFVYLEAPFELVEKRLSQRKDHFFNPNLLKSQFDTLEEPRDCIKVDVRLSPEDIVSQLMNVHIEKYDLGLIGLGVMGKSLARNFAEKGNALALYNRHVPGKEENIAVDFVNQFESLRHCKGYDDIATFVAELTLPRKIFLMVNAGPAVDAVIEALLPHLAQGDVLMDGGNSHYKDTQRRCDVLANKGIHFLGVGVSGGERGALEGPSIMSGGSKEGYGVVGNLLEQIAAKDNSQNACCARVGAGGAGHFVKMIHNGIEYAEMQLITEVYDVLKTNLQLDNDTIAAHFKSWNAGELESYLLGVSSEILTKKEGDNYLIDLILDKAKQKGTGGWSTTAALEVGASIDTISQAVMARIVSGFKKEREVAEGLYSLSRKRTSTLSIDDVKLAYQMARIINHAIGIEALRMASQEYNWQLDLAEITRIWTNGCIIRSALMETLAPILKGSNTSMFLSKSISAQLKQGFEALITFNTEAMFCHTATPVFSAATNYLLAYTRGDSAASMIQAQRDYFGAHTYERTDKPGVFHTLWES